MGGGRRIHRGGIAGLYAFLKERAGAVEADLLRYYQVDLADLGGRRLSWRRLGVLLRYLPDDSATARAQHGTQGWTVDTYLLAMIADHLAAANWQRAGKKNAPKPERLPRPGVEDQRKQTRRFGTKSFTVDEMRRRLAARNGR